MTIRFFICEGSRRVLCKSEVEEIEIVSKYSPLMIMRKERMEGCIKYYLSRWGRSYFFKRENLRQCDTK